MKATHIYTEEEVEYHLHKIMALVQETLLRLPLLEKNPKMMLWQTPFYDIKVSSLHFLINANMTYFLRPHLLCASLRLCFVESKGLT